MSKQKTKAKTTGVQPNVAIQHPELGDIEELQISTGVKKTYATFEEYLNDDTTQFTREEKEAMQEMFTDGASVEYTEF